MRASKRAQMPEGAVRGRVLIIDDQEPTRYVFRRILTNAGFQVLEADTGTEGLTKAMVLPDVIIADVNLPDMLGYDLVRRIKANASTSNIPILQISASFISDESKVQALEGGADSYLIQPVEPAVLIAQVQALIRMRRAEALSHLSASQWQTTFDALSDGLALADQNGALIRANRAFLQLLNLKDSDVQGRPLSSVFESKFGIPFNEVFSGKTVDQPIELSCDNRWFRARYDRIYADPLQESGSILLLTDITHHRKLQETLKMSERLAATGRLAHIIAHEINNPLEALSNLLYLLNQNAAVDEVNSGFIQQAIVQLERIGQITKQLLLYHRESKKPIVASAVDLVEGVLAMFRPQLIANHIEIRSRFKSRRCVYVYPGEMRQAFGNLIANAVDAMEKDGGRLWVSCFDSTDFPSQRKGVRFVFSDSGSGISDENLKHIFDAFFTTKDLKGSGIGLWLTTEVVSKHRGSIRVRSRTAGPYRGSVFDIFLPDHNLAVENDFQIVNSPKFMKL
jgi:two-component system, NtrC family, sensor kinase